MSERAKVIAKTPNAKNENLPRKVQKTDFSKSVSSPVDHILFFQRTIGNQAVQKLFKSGILQAKLRIGQPGDIYEQEADRVADEVIRMPEPQLRRQPEEEKENLIQTKPLVDQITPFVQRHVEEAEEIVETKEVPGQTSEVMPDVEACINIIRDGGQPLSRSVRAYFEPRFGYDFDSVRVHTDAKAAESARAINARAYTVGHAVVCGLGEYAPDTTAGKELLAHELTHVIQQTADLSPILQMQMMDFRSIPKEAIETACFLIPDKKLLRLAGWSTMKSGGMAYRHLEHYLTGGGCDYHVNLFEIIGMDEGVRSRLELGIEEQGSRDLTSGRVVSSGLDGSVWISQADYRVGEYQLAIGGMRLNFFVDDSQWAREQNKKFQGTAVVWVSMHDRYHWSPKDPRITQCVHEAAEALKKSGAKEFYIVGSTYVRLKLPDFLIPK